MAANDDVDDEAMRLWLADGKAPKGLCPHCGSTVSVVQRGGFRARCSHRRCGASGPIMRTITRAVEAFCRPPGYVERHMGIHPSSLTDVVSVLEYDRDAAIRDLAAERARADRAEAELTEWAGPCTCDEINARHCPRHNETPEQRQAAFDAVCKERDEARAERDERAAFAAAETGHANRWASRARAAEAALTTARAEALEEGRNEAIDDVLHYLREAADDHHAKAKSERVTAAAGGHGIAAKTLEGYANGIEGSHRAGTLRRALAPRAGVTTAQETPKRYVAVSKDGSVMRYFDSLVDAAEGGRREFGARFLGAREARESDAEVPDGKP